MKKNIFKTLIASVAALVCVVVCGVTGNVNVAAKADVGDVYTQSFTSVSEVNKDFTAYYQTAMGASNVMMEVVSDENGYGTQDNHIEYVTTSGGEYVYGVGDTLPNSVTDDSGNKLSYTFRVDAMSGDSVTITFTKNTK